MLTPYIIPIVSGSRSLTSWLISSCIVISSKTPCMWTKGLYVAICSRPLARISTEREANAFAAESLMPPALLAAALDGRTLKNIENEELVAGLAKRFRVSTMALQHRLQNE